MRSGQLVTSTDLCLPSFQFERKTGTKDSRLIAQSNFLRLIPEVAPYVIDDLWPTFWASTFAICKKFGRELVGGSHRTFSGRDIFLQVHARACKVRSGLRKWLIKWNLNAKWCRDHALRVLIRMFFDEGLQESRS